MVLILSYEWGFTGNELADLFCVSESRISQMLTQALQTQKKLLSGAISSEKLIERASQKQKTIPRKIQDRPSLYRKGIRIAEELRQKADQRMASCSVHEVPEVVFESFELNTF